METTDSAEDLQPAWHICWQAAKGRDLLVHPVLADMIRSRLLAAHTPRGRHLLHYLLMPSEIHVLSRLPVGEGPKLIAREFASLVSRWVREFDRTRGPVFAARYAAHAIESPTELAFEVRMLAWRPVAMGLCARPTTYMKSSLRATLGLSARLGFEPRELHRYFDDATYEARQAIRKVVRGRPSNFELREWELSHGLALVVGDPCLTSGVAREVTGATAALVAAGGVQGIDGAINLLECWVAHRLHIPLSWSLSTLSGPVGVRARALVAGLAVQSKLCSAAAMARRYGRAKATLCEQMAASKARAEDRLLLETPVESIVKLATRLVRRRRRIDHVRPT